MRGSDISFKSNGLLYGVKGQKWTTSKWGVYLRAVLGVSCSFSWVPSHVCVWILR